MRKNASAETIFNEIRRNAKQGYAFHIGFITERKYNMVHRAIIAYRQLFEMDYKLNIIGRGTLDKEKEIYRLMLVSLETAEIY